MTIGIVNELDDPNIMADANAYSTQYGLPLLNGVGGNPLLTVVKDTALGRSDSARVRASRARPVSTLKSRTLWRPGAISCLWKCLRREDVRAFNELLHGAQVSPPRPQAS